MAKEESDVKKEGSRVFTRVCEGQKTNRLLLSEDRESLFDFVRRVLYLLRKGTVAPS